MTNLDAQARALCLLADSINDRQRRVTLVDLAVIVLPDTSWARRLGLLVSVKQARKKSLDEGLATAKHLITVETLRWAEAGA